MAITARAVLRLARQGSVFNVANARRNR